MSMKQLISEITEAEGGKQQVSRAQVTEILGKLSEKMAKEENDETYKVLLKNGKARLMRKNHK